MKKYEDILLFRQIKNGNKKAFDSLFRKYYAMLVRFGIGYVHVGEESEEIVQDVFIRIWENAKNIEIETSVQAYIYRAVRNKCLNHIKHQEVKRKHELEEANSYSASSETETEKINISYFRNLLAIAIGMLPAKCREVFELAKFEGLSYDEIASHLQVSGKTVENQMGIALKKIRESMMPHTNKIFE